MRKKYGGLGLDKVTQCILAEELGVEPVLGLQKVLLPTLTLDLYQWPNLKQRNKKEKYLVPSIAGEMIGALAITEPNAGTDARSIKTNAVKDGYSMDFEWNKKTWCSNGVICNYVIVAAYTNKEDKKWNKYFYS